MLTFQSLVCLRGYGSDAGVVHGPGATRAHGVRGPARRNTQLDPLVFFHPKSGFATEMPAAAQPREGFLA